MLIPMGRGVDECKFDELCGSLIEKNMDEKDLFVAAKS
jgi:hypothetical protein